MLGWKMLRRLNVPSNARFIHLSSTLSSPLLVPFSSIPQENLGHPILYRKSRCGETTSTDTLEFGIKCAKLCSLGSSAAGLIMIPVLSSQIVQGAAEKPALMTFLVISNAFLALLTFTPLLLHALAKRFVCDVYYNPKTETFTTVHYNFLLRKRALQFKASDVVVAEKAEAMQKMWIPLATCFVGDYPMILLLDPLQYSDQEAYQRLTYNIPPPEETKST
ncbi:unnamed protein product [Bursaphelenchus xylophilus]|uniref:(pine wood nematode) hypothetical protein n=1 Tax=Bursaphelenchus xylophilus TaxID=6326 RepID=A0A1I7RRC4_BURXY|nr:unnamed protein product [Bursaphelenchus xylophilus]CAG9130936.1 unnamed protein product [Bursaphelenchus xylophilus]